MAIITFDENGTVEFTRKPELLALFEGERKEIVRMTDILYDSNADLFYINFLTGHFKGRSLDMDLLFDLDALLRAANIRGGGVPGLKTFWIDGFAEGIQKGVRPKVGFATYEDAVKFEVMIVDDMRKLGLKLDA